MLMATGFFKKGFALNTKLVDLSAALADYHSRLCAVNVNADLGRVTLDLDLRNACCVQLFFQHFAEVVILDEGIAEVLILREPAGIPIFDNAHTETVGIYFLAH